MTHAYDIAVVGSGFAGSLMAMIAKRLGHSVILLEKGSHPRIVIGESSTPLSNLLLETIADRFDLPLLQPLAKWGSWQKEYPHIACGLKRGFTFFHHELRSGEAERLETSDRQLLVAASPNDSIADTHWFRADVDQALLQQARVLEVDYLDECHLVKMERDGESWTLSGERQQQRLTIQARFVFDATGPRGFLHRTLGLREAPLPAYPPTSGLHNHFTGVKPYRGPQKFAREGPPYPPDAAALHHIFEGGWMWVLHFNNGWTSAGFAVSDPVAERFGLQDGEAAWDRMLATLPDVREQFKDAKAMRAFTYIPQLSFRSEAVVGEGWALLPSTAGFVDPILSTGFPLTLLGILRLADALESQWNAPAVNMDLQDYAAKTSNELLATADLIGALYANMGDMPLFRALSLLYFAAASYAETVRRLGKPDLASSFLLCDDERFGPACRYLTNCARQPLNTEGRLRLAKEIYQLVEAFDVGGLTRHPVDHCYPVRAEDLLAGAGKVHASRLEIGDLLKRTGFFSPDS